MIPSSHSGGDSQTMGSGETVDAIATVGISALDPKSVDY